MENKGEIKAVLGNDEEAKKASKLSVEERNDLLKEMYSQIVSTPKFARGTIVEPSGLGVVVGVLDEGQKAIVVRPEDDDGSGDVVIQTFNSQGKFGSLAVDPRFLEKSNKEKK